MIRNIAVGLVAGAIAVVVLVVMRPPAPPPFWSGPLRLQDGDIDSLGIVDGPSTKPATLPSTRPARANPLAGKRLAVFRFDAVPLNEVLESFAKKVGVNVVVNWTALEAAGIQKNVPITIHLEDVGAAAALRVALPESPGSRLGYYVADDIVVITTDEERERQCSVRVYDVRDLMLSAARFGRQMIAHGATTQSSGPILPPVVFGDPPPPSDAALPYREVDLADTLVQEIQQNVRPTTWRDVGGSSGGIGYFGGRLVILQTDEGHEQVEELLFQLRHGIR